jgi:hypothetical protein
VLSPTSGLYRFAEGHIIDIAATIEASPEVFEASKSPVSQNNRLRNAIATIVMAV